MVNPNSVGFKNGSQLCRRQAYVVYGTGARIENVGWVNVDLRGTTGQLLAKAVIEYGIGYNDPGSSTEVLSEYNNGHGGRNLFQGDEILDGNVWLKMAVRHGLDCQRHRDNKRSNLHLKFLYRSLRHRQVGSQSSERSTWWDLAQT